MDSVIRAVTIHRHHHARDAGHRPVIAEQRWPAVDKILDDVPLVIVENGVALKDKWPRPESTRTF